MILSTHYIRYANNNSHCLSHILYGSRVLVIFATAVSSYAPCLFVRLGAILGTI
jgi:hypothetical protein